LKNAWNVGMARTPHSLATSCGMAQQRRQPEYTQWWSVLHRITRLHNCKDGVMMAANVGSIQQYPCNAAPAEQLGLFTEIAGSEQLLAGACCAN
jgi:hypothetical protein